MQWLGFTWHSFGVLVKALNKFKSVPTMSINIYSCKGKKNRNQLIFLGYCCNVFACDSVVKSILTVYQTIGVGVWFE